VIDLICGRDELVAAWVKRRTPWVTSFDPCKAIGVYREGRALAGVVYYNYRPPNIDVTIAADDPRWCRKGVLAGLFSFPFMQLECRRITCVIPASNKRSIKLCRGLGFKDEGFHPALFLDGSAGISLGMLREDCRWLRGIDNVSRGIRATHA
jgi:RimJ/RimL family protein N-acetyltransferase